MPIDEPVSVADESIYVMLSTMFARRHFENVRNAEQCFACVTIYNNLPNKTVFIVNSTWNSALITWIAVQTRELCYHVDMQTHTKQM